ncbi:MAG: anaerobic C4-dicarboxylate transporter [Campylobacteraceae bacterium]
MFSGTLGLVLQLAVVLFCLFYGAKKGGIALGLLGGIGLVILVFVFNLPPGKIPIDVMLTIIAVVAASATLQASGGLDVMLQIAEKILRRNPKYVTILAPFVTMFLTMLCGTGHVVYTIMPIIYDIAIKNNIRPERPMAAASISSQMGICASPVSVAVVSFAALLASSHLPNGSAISLTTILSITIPCTMFGVLVVGLFSLKRGKDLEKDPIFQEFISTPENKQYVYGSTATLLGKKLPKEQWLAMWIFLAGIAVIATLGIGETLRPAWCTVSGSQMVNGEKQNFNNVMNMSLVGSAAQEKYSAFVNAPETVVKDRFGKPFGAEEKAKLSTPLKAKEYCAQGKFVEDLKADSAYADYTFTKSAFKQVGMVNCIQILMFFAGAMMVMFTKMDASKISKNEIFRSGMIAIVAVFGIAWMADTVFDAHVEDMKLALGGIVKQYPWTYAIMILLVSKFLNSQAASVATMVPIALAVGVEPGYIIAFAAACYGYYILPTYPSDLATIQFDRSGTTRIGKYVINHSFIIPGLLGVFSSCVLGFILAKTFGYV